MKLSTTYKIEKGDTLDSVARKVYGSEAGSARILSSNPGGSTTLIEGTSIFTPADPQSIASPSTLAPAATPDETSVLIDGIRFRYWDSVSVVRSVDSFDSVTLTAPYSVDLPEFKEAFRPFTFKTIEVYVGGVKLFTGTMITITPDIDADRKAITAGGYALPGVLNDCTMPASAFPLEFNGQTLTTIAAKVLDPFGLAVIPPVEPGPVFKRVACKPEEKVLEFIARLAQQRDLVVSNDTEGALTLLKSPEPGSPVATLRQGEAPLIRVSPDFKAQGYFSHLTGIEQTTVGAKGVQYTVKNERLEGVLRPLNFVPDDAVNADIKQAVSAKMGRMFANAAAFTVEVDTWRTPSGDLWSPNTTIILIAPDAMVYTEYEFEIRSVTLNRDEVSKTATLDLIIPGSFSGIMPEALPWDE